MKEIIESLHLPVGSEYVKHFLIKQGYTYKKKSLYAKEQDCPRCAGKEIAEMIYERHELLTECLTKLGVDPEVAAEDACRIEHVISAESFAAIKAHIGAGTSK